MMAIITACKMGVIEASPAGVISNNGDSGASLKAKQ
jgi:folate-dependent phosphoribosylglycinamide formyltransferase PurN